MADGFQSPPDLNASAIKRRSFSVVELDAMFDADILSRDEKIELIDGEIIQMNAQMMRHGVIKQRLANALTKQLPDQFEVYTELTVQLGPKTVVDPDILVTSPVSPEDRYVAPAEVCLAIEVSVTSLAYDLGKKAVLYARAKVPELWVVDINARLTWVHRQPTETGFASIESAGFDVPLVPLCASTVSVCVAELFV